ILKWAQAIGLSGDLRYRHEWIDQEDKDDRHRHRIRLRLNVSAKVNEQWDAGLRLATGSKGDPVSTNQDLGQAFSDKPVWLDAAYASYHPDSVKGLNITAGKADVPFYAAGRNQLIWDHDLTPEGICAQYGLELAPKSKLLLTAGGFWVAENATEADPALWGIQGYLQQSIGTATLVAGLSYYNFTHLKGYTALNREWDGSTTNKFFGNSSTGGRFANDYDLLEVFGQLDMNLAGIPISTFGTYVINTATEAGFYEDTGWLIGLKVNKASEPGSWELSYDYRDIGADAVVGQFNDSDFIGGGTDGKGHRFSAAYQWAKNVQLGLTYYNNTITRTAQDIGYDRLQLDLVVKFK
ncbi:MAG: putative porin, partial [Sedimentisphaerales bacterium]|nr:putative porin [Sedimentisphaerales bacterium]